MRLYAYLIYFFLYFPIAIIVFFSFNSGKHASDFQGFSLKWYPKLFDNPFLIDAFNTSLMVAFISAILASTFGTMAAIGLNNLKGKLRVFYDSLVYISVMIPGIVIGIATLIALVTLFGFLNPLLASIWPMGLGKAPTLNLGYVSLIGAHTLFTMSLSILIVRSRLNGMDRNLIEASNDLYGTPIKTFLKITLPQLFPAILSAFLLSFTFSFDDFIIAFFVAGSETTLPVYVFSSIRRGVTPEINAIATLILTFTILLLLASHLLMKYKNYNNKGIKK